MKRTILLLCGIVVVGTAGFGYRYVRSTFSVDIPTYTPAARAIWLDQNWTQAQQDWFHNADQGTRTFGIPYEWLIALEQPDLSLTQTGLLADPAYLDRYGFIPPTAHGETLPVGFARGTPMLKNDGSPWSNPQSGKPMAGVGLTCAACHTGRLDYRGTEILIDGGPALTNLGSFKTGLGLSLFFTRYYPFRFGRFADRVLGPGHGDAAGQALRAQLDAVLKQDDAIHKLDLKIGPQSVAEGFGRLDAINRIGNTVFGLDLDQPANYLPTDAPVHYPHIWDSSWFDWVQYNASIEQPMVRNAGEALGVAAGLNLSSAGQPLFASTVQVGHIYEMEQLLTGKQPDEDAGFNGLAAPKWPGTVLPPIDMALAAKGGALYTEICAGCHLAPVQSPAFWASPAWLPANAAGERYLHVELVPIAHVGTDPAQATDMARRQVVIPASLGLGTAAFGPALGKLVEKTVNVWYDAQTPPTPPAQRTAMNGNRDNAIQAPLAYKVRPLDGIWATPPYLHNGAVPTLYALLSPVQERPSHFTLGNREYDAINVGYRTEPLSGGFDLLTDIPGNLNTGHEFTDDTGRPGKIGRGLAPAERRALVEYLKTL